MSLFKIYPGVDPDDYKFPPLIRQSMALYEELIAAFSGKYLEQDVANHKANQANPHAVTKTQIGLSDVDNTNDGAKPISIATGFALAAKAPLASPTFTGTVSGVSKTMVGLPNVDNTSDASKPVSTAQQTALNLKANAASPAFTGTPTGLTKTHVGLSNVDNTSDASKPVSTPQSTLFGAMGKGSVASVSNAAALPSLGGTEIVGNYVAVSLIAGRRYTAKYRFTSTASLADSPFRIRFVKSGTSDTTIAGTLIEYESSVWTANAADSTLTHFIEVSWEATTTETVNVKVNAVYFGSATVIIDARRLTIFDDGDQF